MINANKRIERTCSRLWKSSSSAPTAGVNVMIVRMFDLMISMSPQKPHHDQHSAQ